MVLNIYKSNLIIKLDMMSIANEFISGNEHRLRFFAFKALKSFSIVGVVPFCPVFLMLYNNCNCHYIL